MRCWKPARPATPSIATSIPFPNVKQDSQPTWDDPQESDHYAEGKEDRWWRGCKVNWESSRNEGEWGDDPILLPSRPFLIAVNQSFPQRKSTQGLDTRDCRPGIWLWYLNQDVAQWFQTKNYSSFELKLDNWKDYLRRYNQELYETPGSSDESFSLSLEFSGSWLF